MPRGRPPGSKNKSTLQKQTLFSAETTKQEVVKPRTTTTQIEPPVKNVDKYRKCMLCGAPLICDARSVQLTSFTGQAYWHRDIPDMIRMCGKCSAEFSDVVQAWLIKHGAPMRLGYQEEDISDG